jgi:hypothetical protein
MEDKIVVSLTKKQLKEIVAEGVQETFTQLGLDHENPLEMQRDFQYLREWRTASEKIKTQGIYTIMAIWSFVGWS